jgi:NADH-quinone oxidoreductase subunit L
MINELGTWFIFFCPLLAFAFIGVFVWPFIGKKSKLSGYITIFAISCSTILSFWALGSVIHNGHAIEIDSHNWVKIQNIEINVGIMLDGLTTIMLVVVSSVSLLVQIYSTGYMKNDSGYSRYFMYMSLFTASMIGLVLASNLIQMFVFWELVGASSYLLIGFWFNKPAAAAAAKKAFIVTRLGDFGFLLAILYLFFNSESFLANGLNPFEVADINNAIALGVISSSVAGWVAVGMFAGAMGKSAQFPLHAWLPDAMEGPTPVSALIHAATMVAAGIFLVARFFPLFEASKEAMMLVALVGGVTAMFAASIGLVQNDIKRVLAYSTISQLGYMMLALGVGAYSAAIFHLFTHAFFKALLFLTAGSVSHSVGGTFDMRYMGGLRRLMPWTYGAVMIGGLSLSGIFPMAGFWSKDEILNHAWHSSSVVSDVVFWLAIIAAFLTAFYMFRAIFMTFEGKYKGGAKSDPSMDVSENTTPHESPTVMIVPLILLALATVTVGWLVNPLTNIGSIPIHWFADFIHVGDGHEKVFAFNKILAVIASLVAVSGILLAYLMYVSKVRVFDGLQNKTNAVYKLLASKYYFDEFYEDVITRHVFYSRFAAYLDAMDKSFIDGVVRTIDRVGRNIGRLIAQIQTGQLQGYGVVTTFGVLLLFGIYLIFR